MALPALSEGSVEQMVNHFDSNNKLDGPILQILSIKKIPAASPGSAERFRVILSDGKHFCQSMLAMQLKSYVDAGNITRNCLVKVTDYASNHIQSRRILILLGLEKVADCAERIGHAVNLEQEKPTESEAAPASKSNNAVRAKPEKRDDAPSFSTSNYSRTNGVGTTSAASRLSGVGGTKSKLPIYPIEGLSPYQTKWTIRARVTQKGEIKHFTNQRGPGQLFSVNFLDESSEIRATGFGDAVDKFYTLLKEGHVYYVSKARVVMAKKQFSNLPNEYELQLGNETEIAECEDQAGVPTVTYNFVPLNQLESVEPNQTCDVLGIVESVGEMAEIISKATQKPIPKRELTLVDSSGMSVRLTLWGKTAENFRTDEERPIIAFKAVRVGDFGGRSLSMNAGSSMSINPDLPEAFSMRGWYESDGNKTNFKSYSNGGGGGGGAGAQAAALSTLDNRITLGEVQSQNLGKNEETPDYFNTCATVVWIKADNLWYNACPSDGCNKKVTEDGDMWRCEKCDRSYDAPQARYIFTANVADHTGQIWVNGFNEVGEDLIGMSANDLAAMKEESQQDFEKQLKKVQGQMFLFNCRAKMDTFGDSSRIKYQVTRIARLDYVNEGNLLADAIAKYLVV